MKKLLMLGAIAILASCKEEAPKDYVTFSGKIENNDVEMISINSRDFRKEIAVNADGTFSDTLKVKTGVYYFDNGSESTQLFLKNGYDINMTVDSKEFDETVKYAGEGAENSTYLSEKMLFEEKIYDQNFDALGMKELDAKIVEMSTSINEFIDSKKGIDTILTNQNKLEVSMMMESFKNYYGEMISLRIDMPKGSPSPVFEDFENIDGSKTSLADLKGKNVYIDVWATWCAPCKAEIPALKQLEKDYHGKNIAFVSMSIDDDRSHGGSWEQAKTDWKTMVKDMDLGGIQIYAPNGWQTKFIRDYRVNGIPRFILLDKEGNIVDASAPRPSEDTLRTLLDGLI
ncbi:hypothetical protein ULMA_25930 [Patiriisocius marinus]|uniref:Thioredoxin domain-containing protein n=1 Tax=Patiriisocius marinus TaxID=1397112 RepID=A0A5J4IRG8_9FLAO|nr:TlpA disulfide reductase family protein [Patiriisocius marinus]GER60485.1 hypothetical protein ULMA_25930 [Patiriisocius marinus]